MEAATTADYKALYEKEKAEKEALQIAFTALRHEVEQLKKMIFGSRHERFEPALPTNQLSLELAVDAIATASKTEEITVTKTITKTTSKPIFHPGRSPLPSHLRREETIIEPSIIPEGSKKIGEEITEELEYTQGDLFVKKYIRPKYVVPQLPQSLKSEIIIAPMPDRPIDKCMAGPGLLAQVIIDKYVDHLPLYRQLQRFERIGVKLPDATISGWITAICKLLLPLYDALKQEIFKSGYIHADETTIKVLDSSKKGTTHRGYFWVYNNSPGRLVLFDYQEGRSAEAPKELLNNFKGYLQTDGYSVYEDYDKKEGITLLHCMAHARRKFIEAQNNDAARCSYALEQIQQLYAIERDCKEKKLTNQQRQGIRQQKAIPILEHLGSWMKEQYVEVLPKSTIGQALAYSLTRWDKLSIYTTNGMLCIDNNPVENSIRPVAIGRKNYLFAGSHEGAKRSAMLYSLLGTCKMNNINPYTWLKEILTILPSYPINKINDLLPNNYAQKQS